MNVGSGAQVQQLLFPGISRRTSSTSGRAEHMPEERVFKVLPFARELPSGLKSWLLYLPLKGLLIHRCCQLLAVCSWPEKNYEVWGPICIHPGSCPLQVPNVDGLIEEGKKAPKKNMDITLHGLWGNGNISRLTPEVFTPSGWPAVSTPVLRSLAGKPGVAKKALAELQGRVDVLDFGTLLQCPPRLRFRSFLCR